MPSTTACFVGLGCLPGGTWARGAGKWAGLASALGGRHCWARGIRGPRSDLRRQQKGDVSRSPRANLFNTLYADIGQGPPQGFESI